MSTVVMSASLSVGAVILFALGFWLYLNHLGHKEKLRLKEMRTRFLTGEMDKHH